MFEEPILPMGDRAMSHGSESPVLGVFETDSKGVEAGCPTFSIDVGWGLGGVTMWAFFCVLFGGARQTFPAVVTISVGFPEHAVGGVDDLSSRAWLLWT